MKNIIIALIMVIPSLAFAQSSQRNPCYYSSPTAEGCIPVSTTAPLPITAPTSLPITAPAGVAQASQYPIGAIPITGNAQGITGAVVGTLAASVGKTTYICGFHIDATGTLSIGPITIAGLVGSSMVFQGTAGSNQLPSQTFTPCIPASAPNTTITITTTADASATAVDVNSWGYQQ